MTAEKNSTPGQHNRLSRETLTSLAATYLERFRSFLGSSREFKNALSQSYLANADTVDEYGLHRHLRPVLRRGRKTYGIEAIFYEEGEGGVSVHVHGRNPDIKSPDDMSVFVTHHPGNPRSTCFGYNAQGVDFYDQQDAVDMVEEVLRELSSPHKYTPRKSK
jgi:hypothetical protein